MNDYNLILCDPPWTYRDKANAGNRGSEFKYPCMTNKQLRELYIYDLAAPDCALFLWSTCAMLPLAIDLMKCWKFKFVTSAFTWVKITKNHKSFTGMGSYTRMGSEYCLLGTRGKLKVRSHSVRQVITSPVREHSQKPDEVRNGIVELFGNLPRIELFARTINPGWDCWGLDVPANENVDDILYGRKLIQVLS